MARRRKGRAVHGWLIVDKPKGVTSTAVVNKARWAFNAQKAGHAGTLDPLATGLLAVAFGEATKAVPIAQDGLKSYVFTVRLGEQTTTDDAEGEIVARSAARPTDAEIIAALPTFIGEIMQVPPQFSAVKVDGERAYDLARAGAEIDLAARPLFVESLALTSRPDPDHAVLELVCGKGGYVRSIARDLGISLGCFGHVEDLRRTASGSFSLDDALTFEALDDLRDKQSDDLLLTLEQGLGELPEIVISPHDAARLANGNHIPVAYTDLDYGDRGWASCDGRPVAVVAYKAGYLHPVRVFNLDQPGQDG